MNLHTDRVRFNWGFHDGANDKLRGKAHRTEGDHLFSLPSGDKVYREGYPAGYAQSTNDSSAAWTAHRQALTVARTERRRIRDMRPAPTRIF